MRERERLQRRYNTLRAVRFAVVDGPAWTLGPAPWDMECVRLIPLDYNRGQYDIMR